MSVHVLLDKTFLRTSLAIGDQQRLLVVPPRRAVSPGDTVFLRDESGAMTWVTDVLWTAESASQELWLGQTDAVEPTRYAFLGWLARIHPGVLEPGTAKLQASWVTLNSRTLVTTLPWWGKGVLVFHSTMRMVEGVVTPDEIELGVSLGCIVPHASGHWVVPHGEARKRFLVQVRGVGLVCGLCGTKINSLEEATQDHIIPVSQGGPDVLANVQLAHRSCNEMKGNALPEQYPPFFAPPSELQNRHAAERWSRNGRNRRGYRNGKGRHANDLGPPAAAAAALANSFMIAGRTPAVANAALELLEEDIDLEAMPQAAGAEQGVHLSAAAPVVAKPAGDPVPAVGQSHAQGSTPSVQQSGSRSGRSSAPTPVTQRSDSVAVEKKPVPQSQPAVVAGGSKGATRETASGVAHKSGAQRPHRGKADAGTIAQARTVANTVTDTIRQPGVEREKVTPIAAAAGQPSAPALRSDMVGQTEVAKPVKEVAAGLAVDAQPVVDPAPGETAKPATSVLALVPEEPAGVEPTPVQAPSAESAPVDTEPVDAEPAQSEPVKAESVEAAGLATQPASAVPLGAQPEGPDAAPAEDVKGIEKAETRTRGHDSSPPVPESDVVRTAAAAGLTVFVPPAPGPVARGATPESSKPVEGAAAVTGEAGTDKAAEENEALYAEICALGWSGLITRANQRDWGAKTAGLRTLEQLRRSQVASAKANGVLIAEAEGPEGTFRLLEWESQTVLVEEQGRRTTCYPVRTMQSLHPGLYTWYLSRFGRMTPFAVTMALISMVKQAERDQEGRLWLRKDDVRFAVRVENDCLVEANVGEGEQVA